MSDLSRKIPAMAHWRENKFFVAFEDEDHANMVRGSFIDVACYSSVRKACVAYANPWNLITGFNKSQVTCTVELWHPLIPREAKCIDN